MPLSIFSAEGQLPPLQEVVQDAHPSAQELFPCFTFLISFMSIALTIRTRINDTMNVPIATPSCSLYRPFARPGNLPSVSSGPADDLNY